MSAAKWDRLSACQAHDPNPQSPTPNPRMKSVAIIGTGLIGASFGLALRKEGFDGSITGVSSQSAIAAALAAGAIDCGAPLAEAVAQADLVFPLANHRPHPRHLAPSRPVGPARRIGNRCRQHQVRDRGCRASARIALPVSRRHPMAGKEMRGAAAADPDLFRGRTWVLTPSAAGELSTTAAAAFIAWIRRIGAHPVVIPPAEHDGVVSFTSHLPQMASTALAATAGESVRPEDLRVAGSGLVDMTRLALSSTICGAIFCRPTRARSTTPSASTFRSWSTCARIFGRGSSRMSSCAARPPPAGCAE